MKLFVFEPNHWGLVFVTMAKTRQDALDSLLNHLKESVKTDSRWAQLEEKRLRKWMNVNINDPSSFPVTFTGRDINGVPITKKYSIEEHDPQEVLQFEYN